jgi:type I restriction enzyme, S subunit
MANQMELLLVGSTFKRINISEIKALSVIIPPAVEQEKICSQLDIAIAELDDLISNNKIQIKLLQEFRNRLIADVVTGKLDAREVARQLPDEVEEIEPDTETTSVVEDELQESETIGEAYG